MSSGTATIETRSFNLPLDNIDTDQIIPACFLTTTEREGLGKHLFHHWRYHEDDTPREEHLLSDHSRERHQVLVAGTNFGCGSSREHAPWALLDFGIRAVISNRFADIFRNNALKNGLLPVVVEDHVLEFLHDHHDHPVIIDVPNRRLIIEGYGTFEFPLNPFSSYCLTRGINQLDFILQQEQEISRYEQRNDK